ncbi:MAG: membrane protein insertion efficiency factor YidD [Acidisphaera sp.]|nr:membrane protein insertion efficiency factor YidD [Acidisphaera sp.]
MSGAARLLAGMVRVYQWTLRPLIGAHCRFVPSCSDYALEALELHGAAHGSLLAGRRILRCNPWVAGGLDPVPPPCSHAICTRGRTAR